MLIVVTVFEEMRKQSTDKMICVIMLLLFDA